MPVSQQKSSSSAGVFPAAIDPRAWEERFGEVTYGPLLSQAWERALAATSLSADDIDNLIVTGTHGRAVARNAKRLGVRDEAMVDDLSGSVGNTGTAHPLLVLTSALEQASPGETIAVMTLADGVEVIVLRTTHAITAAASAMSTADQIASGTTVSYGTFLSWRGMVSVEPPNRPLRTARPHRRPISATTGSSASSAAATNSGMIHLPPARVSEKGGAVDDMEPVPMADTVGTVVSFTIDKLVYSPSPPVVFAVVDFDGGGRARSNSPTAGPMRSRSVCRCCDVSPLFTADEIHNYFWKVAPVRGFASGFARHQGQGRDHRHGLHALHRALGQVTRRPDHRRSPAHLCLRGHHQDDIGAFWFGTSQSAASGLAMGGPLKVTAS